MSALLEKLGVWLLEKLLLEKAGGWLLAKLPFGRNRPAKPAMTAPEALRETIVDLDMPMWLKVRLDQLFACNSADEVANLYRQENVQGRKDVEDMCPTAVFMGKERCTVELTTTGISIWEHGSIRSWRIPAPSAEHVLAFEEAFHRGEYESLHMFRDS